MFSDLPNLFDRDYATAFVLPLVILLAAAAGLAELHGLLDLPSLLTVQDPLITGSLVVVTIWLGSLGLLILNFRLYRLLEGYGRFNPFRVLSALEKRRYAKLNEAISRLRREYRSLLQQENPDPEKLKEIENKLTGLIKQTASDFPDQEDFLLPTRFGNTLRAFEVYPRVMYGLDSIPGWYRLLAVVPVDYRKIIDSHKAQVDFWVNLWFSGVLMLAGYLAIAAATNDFSQWWLIPLCCLACWVFFQQAVSAAHPWGDVVKAAFDVYLPDLRAKIGNEQFTQEEHQFWEQFSGSMLARYPHHAAEETGKKKKKSKKDG